MYKVGKVDVRSAVFCEDVRREIDNKNTLVGVISGDILVKQLPANIRAAFYIDGVINQSEGIELELRMSGPGDRKAVSKLSLNPKFDGDAFSTGSPQFLIQVENEGAFKICLRAEKGRWVNVIAKKIMLSDVPN